MKVLIFSNQKENPKQEIENVLEAFAECPVVLTESFSSFRGELSSCLSGETIIVFCIEDEKDITFLESMESRFVDVKLIINLPDPESLLQSRAFKLQPRIITYSDGNREILPAVVQSIVKNKFSQNKL